MMERKKKVLIVDNNEWNLWSVQALLENAGFDTRTTWSGREALDQLAGGEFDVLLVDDYLPDLHAGEFLERVRRLPVQPWMVVMEGSSPTKGDWKHYQALGVSAVVDKRRLGEIREAVRSCCVQESLVKTGPGNGAAA